MNKTNDYKIAYEVRSADTGKLLGFTDKDGLAFFCETINRPEDTPSNSAPLGVPGWMFNLEERSVYVGLSTFVEPTQEILRHKTPRRSR